MEEGEGDGWELLGRRAVACHTIRREGEGDSGDCRWRTNWSTLFIWRPPPAAAVPAASMSMWKCQGDGLTQVKDAGGSIKRRPQCFADRTASVLYKHEGRNVALFLSCDLLSLHPPPSIRNIIILRVLHATLYYHLYDSSPGVVVPATTLSCWFHPAA